MDLHSLILNAPMGVGTIILSIVLFIHALLSGIRLTTLERQRKLLIEEKVELETELEDLRVELRGLRLWQSS